MTSPETPASRPSDAPPHDPGAVRVGGRERLVLVVLVLLALVLRIGVVQQYEAGHPYAAEPVIDEAAYEEWGLAIAGGDWLGDEIFFQEPLYPYWLGAMYAVAGHDRTVVRWTQASLGAACVLLVFALTRRVFGSAAALWAAAGMAFYRADLLLPALLLKPNLFLPLWALLAWVLLRTRSRPKLWLWLALGVLAGLGALLRGNVLILTPCFVLWPLARQRRQGLRPAAAVAAGVLLVLLPVAFRNLHVGGAFTLTTSGAGTNLYGGNNAENPDGRATEFSWVRGIPRYEARDWKHEAERRLGRELEPGEVSSFWMGEVVRSMRANPGLHLSIFWNKLRLTLGGYEVPDNHHVDWDARYVPLLRWPFPGWGLLGTLSLAGVVLLLCGRRVGGAAVDAPAGRELLLLALLYLGTIVLTVTSMRVRLALVPVLLPFGGWFVSQALDRLRGRSRVGPGLLVLALALGAVFPLWPVYDAERLDEDLSKRDFNLAVTLVRRGEDLEQAKAILLELEARYGTLRVRTILAQIEFMEAQVEERGSEAQRTLLAQALQRLQSVVQNPGVFPREHYRANRVAGDIKLFLGDGEVAVRRYRDARQFDPEDPSLRLALVEALFLSARSLEGDPRHEALAEAQQLLVGLVGEGRTDLAPYLAEVRAAME